MRIAGLYIDGFGIFRDTKLENLSPGLSIFLGSNESGKSTLLHFIRAILFGFPDGRSSENAYPPIAGGRHGGNIALAMDGEKRYVVERYPGPGGGRVSVLKPDQTRGGKEFLGQLLGVGNRILYKNIYAFSLNELQDFETLNTEAVREALYSAGAGIDPKGLVRLRSDLDRREGDLFKPGGKNPRMNRILSRLNVLSKEKKTLQGSVAEYDRLNAHISAVIKEIDSFEKRKLDLTIQQRKNEQLQNILPEWGILSLSREKLNRLDPVESFPHEGVAEFDRLKTRLEDLRNDLIYKEEELKGRQSDLDGLEVDECLLKYKSSVRRLQKDQGRFEAVLQDTVSVDQELREGGRRLREYLDRLGRHWTEEKVRDFDLSISTREEVRSFQEILSRAQWEEQRKKDTLQEIGTQKREAERTFHDMDEPFVKDADLLYRMQRSCGRIRDLAFEEKRLKGEIRNREDRLGDLVDQKRTVEETTAYRPGILPVWSVPAVLATGLGFMVLTGLYAGWKYAFPILALCLLFGLLLWIFIRKMKREEQKRAEGAVQRSDQLAETIQTLHKEISDLEEELGLIRERITGERSNLFPSGDTSEESLDQVEQDISKNLFHLDQWNTAEKAVKQAENRYEKALEENRRAELDKEDKTGGWKKWLADRSLDESLSPEGVLETLSLIQTSKEQIATLRRLESRKAGLDKERATYSNLVNEVLTGCDKKAVEQNEIHVAAYNLVQDFSKAEQAAQKREMLLKEIATGGEALERMNREVARIQEKLGEWMASAGVDSEEAFRKKGQTFEKRTALIREIERSEDSIRRLAVPLGKPEKILKELETIDPAKLEEERIRNERDLEETEVVLDRLKRDQARSEEQVRQLVNDERISELRNEEEGLREELRALSEEWGTIRLAKGLIRVARERYEKERQPEVISEAGRFFKRMTGGRYTALLSPIGEERIDVVGQDHIRKGMDQLSRGTAEQLYLSLRFGFIKEFSKRSDPLPVIMDEILVNFDRDRARETARGIVELSGDHQILFFTCHPAIAELFRETDPAVPVIELSGGEMKGI